MQPNTMASIGTLSKASGNGACRLRAWQTSEVRARRSSLKRIYAQRRWPSGFLPSVDREQHPVYMERPDGAHIKELLSQFGVDALFRWHIYCLERQRQAVRRMGSDRISIIVDAGKLTMGLLTNSQVAPLRSKTFVKSSFMS
eukprot:RCo028812